MMIYPRCRVFPDGTVQLVPGLLTPSSGICRDLFYVKLCLIVANPLAVYEDSSECYVSGWY